MNFLFSRMGVVVISIAMGAPVAVAAGAVEKSALELGALLGNGAGSYKAPAGDAEAMVKAYFAKQHEDGPDTFVRDATSFNSDASEAGIFKSAAVAEKAALAEIEYCVDNDMVDPDGNDPSANEKFMTKAKALLKRLRAPGVVFGYDAWDQGWGGMPISVLLVIDTKARKVHNITLQCHAYEG